MTVVISGDSGITTPDLTDTSLTSGRVVYAGTSGNLTGSASLVFDGTNLGVLSGSVTTPAAKLHVVGGVRSSNGAGTIFSTLNSDGIYASGTDLYLVAPTGYSNIFYANNVERMRLPVAGGLKTSTTISVGNATPSTSGAGITFPASQDASSNANTLDDYEEGTWTPQPTFGGGTTGMTFSVQSGSYTKIGRSVFISARITFTNKGSATGGFFISSLPFATASGNAFYSGASIAYVDGVANASTWTVQQTIILDAGQTYMLFRYINGSGTSTNHTNSDVGNSLDIIVTATYQSA